MPPRESKRFGRYEVIERLGAGAMGAVYRARDESLGREVAVKTISAPGASSGFAAEMFRARFDNEARAIAALSHDNVVNVFDVGVEGQTPYLVMELVEGPSLAGRCKSGLLDATEAQKLGQQIASALVAAHRAGIVHRDVKPGNILEAGPGKWKLADFGIAHVPDSSLTLTGQFLGSPAYAAPEALGEGQLGPPADVYGLGATMYAALTGQPPFGAGGLLTVGALAADSKPPPISELRPGIPPALAQAIMGAVERDPKRRLTAEQLCDALGRPMKGSNTAATAPARPVAEVETAATALARPVAAVYSQPAGPHRGRAPISRGLAIAIALGILIAGIGLGVGLSSGDGSSRPQPHPLPAAAAGQPTPAYETVPPGWDKKTVKHWRKVEQKLREGKDHEARKHLLEILRRNPQDTRAQELYRRLSDHEYNDEYGYSDEYDGYDE